jgi:hypothetical protein
LLALRQLGEHVGGLVHPAALLARFWLDLTGGLPEPERAIGDDQPRRHFDPAHIEQQLAPVVRALAAPSVNPTSSLRPSGVAPISTRMHCFSSSRRASRWMPSAQI